ncbi:BQ5605_C008g05141 [Microbotryum silenes-dioicae]|uniref:BQ5605_C008g05141 protein n=1 Tax=Microbotryum silenes-dioicae TaxID=796604 RepID=A0A2X0MGY0_9BASI|nr:BQ5605_C008g05141 [Microbotryum silenes-dioicae]
MVPSVDPVALVGINGFGRIGRAAFRASLARDDVKVVAINHTAPDLSYLLHVIRYDSTHGTSPYANEFSITESGDLKFLDRTIKLFSERDPEQLDWASAEVEYVLEATGKMTTVEAASRHCKPGKGAKKVVISSPSKDAKTIVVGVNRREYDSSMQVVSNASCTTNCLAPLAKVLQRCFGIEYGMMTTVHASTSSQHILDGYSKKNRRLGRGVGSNIIPTTTGAATAVQLVLPELTGKFTGISVRVPVNNVSMVDLTVSLTTPVASVEELLKPLREAAAGRYGSSLGSLTTVICVDDDELVSSDFLGYQQSCIVDSHATVQLNPTTFKIIAWYDNEYAYSVRCLDLIRYMFEVDHGLRGGETPTASRPISPVQGAAHIDALTADKAARLAQRVQGQFMLA